MKSGNQLGQGAFAAATATHQGNSLPGVDGEVEVVDEWILDGDKAKADVLENNFSTQAAVGLHLQLGLFIVEQRVMSLFDDIFQSQHFRLKCW